MNLASIFKGSLVAGLLVALAAGDTLAQRGDRGRGDGRGARAAGDGGRGAARSRGPSRPQARTPSRSAPSRAPQARSAPSRAPQVRAPQRSAPSRAPQVRTPSSAPDRGRATVQRPQVQRPDVQRPQFDRGTRDFQVRRPTEAPQVRRPTEAPTRDFRAQFRTDDGARQFGRTPQRDFAPRTTTQRPDTRADIRERLGLDTGRRPGAVQRSEATRPEVGRRTGADWRQRLQPDVARQLDAGRQPRTDWRDRVQTDTARRPDATRRADDPAWRDRLRTDTARRPGDARRPDGDWRERLTRDPRRARGPDVSPELRQRAQRDRGLVDREQRRWRDSAWRGERGQGRDHRDWSGRWREGDRFVAAHHIRDRWRTGRDWHRFPFHSSWWALDRHRHHSRFWLRHSRLHHPFFWWSWLTAPRLTTWVVWDWPHYYYWDYGPGEYIYYWDGAVYVNNQWYAPAPIYYEQTVRMVEEAPALTEEVVAQQEWMPMGVFAVSRDGVEEVDVLLQLAITPDGIIGGTIFDQRTNESFDIEGLVDQETQRTVWSWVDGQGQRILMETSLYNLTQPSATGMAHYAADDMQVIHLVRLEAPDSEELPEALPPGVEATLPPPQ